MKVTRGRDMKYYNAYETTCSPFALTCVAACPTGATPAKPKVISGKSLDQPYNSKTVKSIQLTPHPSSSLQSELSPCCSLMRHTLHHESVS